MSGQWDTDDWEEIKNRQAMGQSLPTGRMLERVKAHLSATVPLWFSASNVRKHLMLLVTHQGIIASDALPDAPDAPSPDLPRGDGGLCFSPAMTFEAFSAINRMRCEAPDGFNHALHSWSLSDWFTATMGELGEAANIAKKLNRERDGIRGNTEAVSVLRERLGAEIADTFIYLDLLAQAAGLSLGQIVLATFNAKSAQIGYITPPDAPSPDPIRLPDGSVHATVEDAVVYMDRSRTKAVADGMPSKRANEHCTSNIRALAAAIAARHTSKPAPIATDRYANDAAAQAIYDGWCEHPDWVPWVARGNSFKQEEARQIARCTGEAP